MSKLRSPIALDSRTTGTRFCRIGEPLMFLRWACGNTNRRDRMGRASDDGRGTSARGNCLPLAQHRGPDVDERRRAIFPVEDARMVPAGSDLIQ